MGYNYKDFTCKECGKLTKRISGNQQFCPECAKIHRDEWVKNYSRQYYGVHKDAYQGYYSTYKAKLYAEPPEVHEKRRLKARKHSRENLISTTNNDNGAVKDIKVKKRPYPENGCEVCGRKVRLTYHHYGKIIPNEILSGIWVCGKCHWKAEYLDRPDILINFLKIYAPIRERIQKEVPPK